MFASPEKNRLYSVDRINIFTGQTKSTRRDSEYGFGAYEFSGDGRYIVMIDVGVPFRLVEINSMKWRPLDQEFGFQPKNVSFTGGFRIVRSHDVALIAADYVFSSGGEEEGKRALVIWNRIKKTFVWKRPDLSRPIAFSPDNRYLLVKGAVWEWRKDKQVAEGILGDSAKFSLDGKLLVTRDNKAFYIYALP